MLDNVTNGIDLIDDRFNFSIKRYKEKEPY